MAPTLTLTLIVILSMSGPAEASGAEPFRPDVAALVPAVGNEFDLALITAGKPEDCYKRAMQLMESLPDLLELNPMEQLQSVVAWVAVTVMVEKAVSSGGRVEEAWDLALVRLYLNWARMEGGLGLFRTAMAMLALQPEAAKLPHVRLAQDLHNLTAYARRGVHWIAGRRLSGKTSKELRTALLEGLVQVHRRNEEWKQMHMAAATLSDLQPSGRAAAWEAEALFELDQERQARAALERAGKDTPGDDLEAARERSRLFQARRALQRERSGKNMARVADSLLKLDEPWRVLTRFSPDQVVAAAHPGLDTAYIKALMVDGLNYQRAWAFGREARGAPSTQTFLAYRIGAGLMMIMHDFYGRNSAARVGATTGAVKKKGMDPVIVAAVRADLKRFRLADARLADLTGLYLVFLSTIIDQDDEEVRGRLRKEVVKFRQAYPLDLAGVQMAYLLAQLIKDAPDPWSTVQTYVKALGTQPPPDEFLPVWAGAAIRKSLTSRDAGAVQVVLAWLDGRAKESPSAGLKLWRAHLLAVRGLLSDQASISKNLQAAVDGYVKYIQMWNQASNPPGTQDELCDAVASVATLLMQGEATAEAQSLLEQSRPACGAFPSFAALLAVMELATGKTAEGEEAPVARLERSIPAIASRQAQIQSHLWLAVVFEAQKDAKKAQEHFRLAANSIAEENKRGVVPHLAPDLRSLVAFSGAFNMGAGYSSQSPFGLAIEVSVVTRMVLFPPAAVDAEKLEPFLKDTGK